MSLSQEGSRDQSQEPIDQVCVRLFDKAEGKDNLPEVNPKDLLVQIINDATVGVRDKRDFYNKLLRKAVFHGNVDIVELVLTDTKDIGVCICVLWCVHAYVLARVCVGLASSYEVSGCWSVGTY